MKKLKCSFPKGSFSASYECLLPKYFSTLFKDMITAYYYSCLKPSRFTYRGDENIYNLLKDYLFFNGIKDPQVLFTPKNNHAHLVDAPILKDRVAVMFTGGKDSLHLLIKLCEKFGKENIIAVYCKNLNRSEACYEKETVAKVCEHLGVKFRLVDITNSIKINRNGHNIGLREQLILTCALPYVLSFGASKIFYGLHDGFEKMSPPLYSSHKKAFKHIEKSLEAYGVKISITNHIDYPEVSEVSILKDLIENHYDLFRMTNSCYTQKNFREMHNRKQQAKYPSAEIYNGCGICLKCLRINAAIVAYDGKFSLEDKQRMSLFIRSKYYKDYIDDSALKELVKINSQYT